MHDVDSHIRSLLIHGCLQDERELSIVGTSGSGPGAETFSYLLDSLTDMSRRTQNARPV